MPILEYACKECQHHFETLVFGAQQPVCPTCQSSLLERRLSVFAVGGHSGRLAAQEPLGPCGTCGDPRGPGACSFN